MADPKKIKPVIKPLQKTLTDTESDSDSDGETSKLCQTLGSKGKPLTKIQFKDMYEKDTETPLGYRLKRKTGVDVKHKSNFLKDNSNFIIIVGSTGTGKSTCVLTLIPMFSNLTKYVVLASKKTEDDAHTAVEKYCQQVGMEYYYVHDVAETSNTIADLLDKKQQNEHMIVIYDDFNDAYSAKSDEPHNQIMIKTFATLRSANCSSIAITQSYTNLPPKLRENCTMRIVFKINDVYSKRALLQDTIGLFYTGDDEETIKNDIKKIYKDVYQKDYQFIVITSHTHPQIRMKWNTIVYPPDQAGTIVGGGRPVKKTSPQGQQMIKKSDMYQKATELGFPSYMWSSSTLQQIKDYIKVASAKGQANNGNTAPEIEAILNKKYPVSEKTVRSRLTSHIRSFKRTENPRQLEYITDICNRLVEECGYSVEKVKFILRRNGILQLIEMSDPDEEGELFPPPEAN